MIVNVKTMAGTEFQFASRKDMQKAFDKPNQTPITNDSYVNAWARNAPEWKWLPTRVLHVRRNSVVYVVSAEDMAESDEDLPAKATAEERKRRFEEREAAKDA